MYKIWMVTLAAGKNTQATHFVTVQTENGFMGTDAPGVDESSFTPCLNHIMCETEKELYVQLNFS